MKPRAWLFSLVRVLGFAALAALGCRVFAPPVHPGLMPVPISPPSHYVVTDMNESPTVALSPLQEQRAAIIDKAAKVFQDQFSVDPQTPKWKSQILAILKRGTDIGVSINDWASDGSTLLTSAVQSNGPPEIAALVSLGADPNRRDTGGSLPLEYALIQEHSNTPDEANAAALLRAGADPNLSFSDGTSPLTMAAFYRPELIKLIIRDGGRVNAPDTNGVTPLMAAPYMIPPYESLEEDGRTAASVLLGAGANPNARDHRGRPPLYYAIVTTRSLYSEDNDVEGRLFGVFNPRIIELLLAHGADVRARDRAGLSALHWAVLPIYDEDQGTGGRYENARLSVLRLLLKRGLPVDARDNLGRTPLMFAVETYYRSSAGALTALLPIKFLLEHGANPNARDLAGRSVLDRTHHEWIITHYLRSHGAR